MAAEYATAGIGGLGRSMAAIGIDRVRGRLAGISLQRPSEHSFSQVAPGRLRPLAEGAFYECS